MSKESNKGFFEPCWVPVYPEVVEEKTVDTRDLRDPQKLGETLLEQRVHVRNTYGQDIPLTEIYDFHVSNFPIENYPQDESMCMLTQREYRAELEARKAEGDKYASSALEAIDQGRKIEYDDPAGN